MKYKTIQDYARENDVSRQTVYNWIRSGKLLTKRILGRTLVRLKEAA